MNSGSGDAGSAARVVTAILALGALASSAAGAASPAADAKVVALEPRLSRLTPAIPHAPALHLGLQQPEIEIRTLDKDRRRFLDHRGALVGASGLHYEFRKLEARVTGATDPWKGEPSIRGIF
jgi:hypothetical protein